MPVLNDLDEPLWSGNTPSGIMNSSVVATSTGPFVEEQAAERAEGFTRDGWIFLALAALITILRTYSRWSMVGWKRLQADDVLVWLALVSENEKNYPRSSAGTRKFAS